jgi:hypothetical protein
MEASSDREEKASATTINTEHNTQALLVFHGLSFSASILQAVFINLTISHVLMARLPLCLYVKLLSVLHHHDLLRKRLISGLSKCSYAVGQWEAPAARPRQCP